MKKRSFFERLTGSVNLDEEDVVHEEEEEETTASPLRRTISPSSSTWMEEQAGDGELSVDVYQTSDDIIVRAMIPGVRKEDMDISISRDSITIRGTRKEDRIIPEQDYVVQELYWGSFSRTIKLPHEVDIEHAEANESQGVLTIKLPRVDKDRQTKLKIRSI
ncbi:MAG: Hsp20/alpha crystallin family protein [Candidatus Taylorbacteria bacterium]|nr:Hsp20/alpha crystallin family protein [Candidatus Taylorbacteria bacterium]